MYRGKRSLYIGFGLLVAIVCGNIFLSGYYFQKYQQAVRGTVTSYIENVIVGEYTSAYRYFSDNLKERLPQQEFAQNVAYSIRDSGNYVDYEIIRVKIGNSVGTQYIGPEATVLARIRQTQRESLEEFTLLRHDSDWKIVQVQVYPLQ